MGSNETATKPKRWLNGGRRMGIVLYVIYCVSPGFSLWDEVSGQRGRLFSMKFHSRPRSRRRRSN